LANFLPDDSNPCFPPRVIFRSRLMKAWQHKTTLSAILNHELPEIYHALDLDGGNQKLFPKREVIC
jgi:hypothetical protein